jgi:hypothetical protein
MSVKSIGLTYPTSDCMYLTIKSIENDVLYYYDNKHESVCKWKVDKGTVVQDLVRLPLVNQLAYYDSKSCLVAACNDHMYLIDDRIMPHISIDMDYDVFLGGYDRYLMSQNGEHIIKRNGDIMRVDIRKGFIYIGRTFSSAMTTISAFIVVNDDRQLVFCKKGRIYCIDLTNDPLNVLMRLKYDYHGIDKFTMCDNNQRIVFFNPNVDTVYSCLLPELSQDAQYEVEEFVNYTGFDDKGFVLEESVISNDMQSCFSKMHNVITGSSLIVYSHG